MRTAKSPGKLRFDGGDRPFHDLPRRAVDGDQVAGAQRVARREHRATGIVDANIAGSRNARLAHAAGDDRGMGSHAAAGGQDAFGGVHAVNVFGARFDTNQNDLPALRLELLGLIGIEHDRAAGRARRSGQAGADDVAIGIGIQSRVEQLVERRRLDARNGLITGDHAFVGEIDGDFQARLWPCACRISSAASRVFLPGW